MSRFKGGYPYAVGLKGSQKKANGFRASPQFERWTVAFLDDMTSVACKLLSVRGISESVAGNRPTNMEVAI